MFEKIKDFFAKVPSTDAGNRDSGSAPGRPSGPGAQNEAHQATARAPARHLPPLPRWKPTIAVDIERTASTADFHLGGKFSFAVLEHGTCVVLSPEELANPQGAVENVMQAVLFSPPDVKTRPKNDGNWLVLYSQPVVATVVFGDVVQAHWDYIEKNHPHGMVEGEVFRDKEGRTVTLNRDIKIALFGRSCMFMDAVAPRVVKVWHAKPG